MKPFDYCAPHTLEEALEALHGSGGESRVLAGGTDILIEIRKTTGRAPQRIVDISRIAALHEISFDENTVVVGPLVTHAQLAASDIIRTHAPLLAEAAASLGSPQIRNRGTVGGNIMNAAACADTVPPLVALGASVTLRSVRRTRKLPLVELFEGPYTTVAEPGDLLTRIAFPPLPPNARSTFIKLGRRNAVSIARLSVAAILVTDNAGVVTDARIVPGAAFPCWMRVHEAEAYVLGKTPTHDICVEAGKAAAAAMIARTGRRWSTEYKEPVLGVLVRRALEQASGIHN
jgi:CO/xanthine dehydrogenase FAD-binding subunit